MVICNIGPLSKTLRHADVGNTSAFEMGSLMDNALAEYEKFAATIGVTFNDVTILREAFTHRSYLNEHRGTNMKHNERLEFLGDAVLELAVTEFLFAKYQLKFVRVFQNGISMPKCACGKKPQDDDIMVKGK